MHPKYYWLIVFIALTKVGADVRMDIDSFSPFKSSVKKTAWQVFENCLSVTVIAPNPSVFNKYMRDIDFPMMIFYINHNLCYKPPKKEHISTGHIIITKYLDSMTYRSLKCIGTISATPAETNILIVQTRTPSDNNQETHGTFLSKLWNELNLVKVLILPVYSYDSLNIPYVFAYNPFFYRHHERFYCNNVSQTKFNEKYSKTVLNISVDDYIPSVMSNRFKNMHGNRLYVLSSQLNASSNNIVKPYYPSVKLKSEIESFFNLKLIYFPFKEGNRMKKLVVAKPTNGQLQEGNETYHIEGIMRIMSINPFFSLSLTKESRLNKIKYTSPMFDVPIGFIMHRNSQVESWKIFLFVFDRSVWITLLVAFILLNVSFTLLKIQLNQTLKITFSEIVFHSSVLITKSILSVSQNLPESTPERLLLASCLCLSLVLITCFNSRMFFLESTMPRTITMDTIQQIFDSNKPIITHNVNQTSSAFSSSVLRVLIPRLIQNSRGVYQLLNFGNFSVIGQNVVYTPYTEHMAMAANHQNISTLHLAKEIVTTDPCASFVSFYWSRYYDMFNMFILKIHQHGFNRKWNREFQLLNKLNIDQNLLVFLRREKLNETEKPLSYDMLLFPMYILYLGCFVSSIVFLFEIICFKRIFINLIYNTVFRKQN